MNRSLPVARSMIIHLLCARADVYRNALGAPAACALLLAACASPGIPPGGPERLTPPMIIRINPDTNRVNVARGRDFVVTFDEVVSERPASAPNLADLVLISPRDGEPVVDWHRDEISLHPRRGWRPNTAYTVTLLPGIADLRGNVRDGVTQVTFSTGPRIPATVLNGIVFDALTGEPVINALVEARPATDSTLVYIAVADSLGRFRLRGLAPMQYAVRGYADRNRNRGLDPGEPLDSTRLNLADSASLELLAFVHDSVGPKIGSVSAVDSTTIRVTFSTPLDPRTPLDVAHFLIFRADSSRVAVRSVAAVRQDTAGVATDQPPVASQSIIPVPGSRPRGAPPLVVPRPVRPLLFRDVDIVTAAPLQPGATYRVQAVDALGPSGRKLTSERTFAVPRAAAPVVAPADSSATRSSTATPPRPPSRTPPATPRP